MLKHLSVSSYSSYPSDSKIGEQIPGKEINTLIFCLETRNVLLLRNQICPVKTFLFFFYPFEFWSKIYCQFNFIHLFCCINLDNGFLINFQSYYWSLYIADVFNLYEFQQRTISWKPLYIIKLNSDSDDAIGQSRR